MKKSFLAIAGLALILAGCAKKEDISNLQSQIDEIKDVQIKTITDQISGIKTSISNLEKTDAELQNSIDILKAQEIALEKADQSLAASIADLKTELYGAISSTKTELLNKIDAEKNGLLAKIADINASIAGLRARDEELAASDENLQGQIDELNSELSALQSKYDSLSAEAARIESELSARISAAEANCLAQLAAYKQTMDGELLSVKSTIAILQSKDEDLQKQINNLKTYIDSGIQDARDWASATFATLEQYNTTADIVATIQTQITSMLADIEYLKKHTSGVTKDDLDAAISGLDSKLQEQIKKVADDAANALDKAVADITAAYSKAIQEAVAASEASLKNWVNSQLSAYYTATQTDALLSVLKSDLEGQLASQKTYLEGLINGLQATLGNKIDANKTLIDGLQSQVNNLSADLSTLAGKVATNSTNISANAKAISDNATAISQNAGDINACEKLIAANRKLIDENTAAINANDKDIADLQSRATADEKKIADNAAAIAKNAADIAKNGELIAANATAISNNAKAISDNAAEIVQLKADLIQAKKDITEAYTKAIGTAINELDGKLSGQIATEVATLNKRIDDEVATINAAIDALKDRVTTCEKDIKSIKQTIYGMQQDIEDLQEQVTAILARIQSISFVPRYSDGKAIMTYTDNGTITPGTAEFDFELQPSATATELAKVWKDAVSMSAVYTVTKSAPETVALTVENVTADKGYVTVTVSGKGLKNEYFKSQCSANVRLKISDGNNEKSSDYIQMVPWTTDVISFADAAFKAYLVENFDTTGDGEISAEEAEAVTEISASMLNIASTVGIEYFKNLVSVDLSYNKLTAIDLFHSQQLKTIDVSGNKIVDINVDGLSALETFDCSSNKIETLNVSESKALKTLNCNSNQIGSLVLNNNKNLTELQCNNNNLTALNLKNNTKLKTLYCRKNSIGTIDVSGMPSLVNLDFSSNVISSVNLYKSANLENLYCSSNKLTSLDISSCSKLIALDCGGNSIATLITAKNQALESVDCSSNALTRLDVSANTSLQSVTCDKNASMTKLWVKNAAQKEALTIKKDAATVICYNDGGINIPDANLKAYLVANYDDDADGEISIAESENITNVNCSGKGISKLDGLDYCTNLQVLDCSNNSIASIVLPGLEKLTTIKCFGNPINEIDLSNCSALQHFYLQAVDADAFTEHNFKVTGYVQASSLKLNLSNTSQYNANINESDVLETIDVSSFETLKGISTDKNPELVEVRYPSCMTDVYANKCPKLTGIDVSACQNLVKIEMTESGLTSIDVTNNTELTDLYIQGNSLAALDVTHNTKLVKLTAQQNHILSVNVTNCPVLTHLDMGDNKLSAINVRNNPLLETLSVAGNAAITILNVEKNTALKSLDASRTGITDIELAANLALEDLNVSSTSLATLDVSKNTSLATLDCNEGIHLICGSAVKPISSLTAKWAYVDDVKAVFFTFNNRVKAMSTDEASKTWGYYGTTTNATSKTDGAANTDKIASGSDAAKWCRAKGSAWYLPALDELKAIYNNKSTLNSTLSKISGTQLGTGYYWSSTENSSITAYYIDFGNGSSSTNFKSNLYTVRAVRAL